MKFLTLFCCLTFCGVFSTASYSKNQNAPSQSMEILTFPSIVPNLIGDYQASDGKKEIFSLSLKASGNGKGLNDLDFLSSTLGKCSNQASTEASGDYGYYVYNDDEPILLRGEHYVTTVQATIFCKSEWFTLFIEIPIGAFSQSLSTKAAYSITNGEFKTIEKKTIVLKKMN